MEINEAIYSRRSVRGFTDRVVETEKLEELVKAGFWAPTAGNAQPWEFIIVTKPEKMKLIKTVSPGLLGNPSSCIAVCSDIPRNIKKMGPIGEILAVMDCSMAAENIMLKACDLGLGSCVIRSFNQEAVREVLGAPKHIMPELLITLGYFEGNPGNPKRREDVIHWNKFGGEK